ncbi:MAG: GNAT family N-acetyltransferase [Rikenellaceae bacterium]|nr:GNAT family N-acetyltransferase [Rikenellaceae bacterium]
MNNIRIAGKEDFPIIQDIAAQAWPEAFKDILSYDQIEYMMEMMYSNSSLEKQITEQNHLFLLSYSQVGEKVLYTGYASYEVNYNRSNLTKLHKLYLLPQFKGKGIAKMILSQVKSIAFGESNRGVVLNVNRNNPAISFYNSQGFKISGNVDIPIGNGFYMEDYIMEYLF